MAEPVLLNIEDLRIGFTDQARGQRNAVDGPSLDIRKGETVALVGESGSGKSLTALSVLGLLPPTARVDRTQSRIVFDGSELLGASPGYLRTIRGKRISVVFQEPMNSFNPLFTVGDQVAEAIRIHRKVSRREAAARVIDLFRLVEISEPERKRLAYPHELSGGQLQRVMIAMALANEPDLLIADEPTTALDVTIQAQILKLLRDMKARFGMALLLISHDLNVVRRMADRVFVMKDGQIVETAEPELLFSNPRHWYSRQLLSAEPAAQPVRPHEPPVVVEARDVRVTYPVRSGFMGQPEFFTAVDGVTAIIRRGRTFGVVGESGSGKSTFGRALL